LSALSNRGGKKNRLTGRIGEELRIHISVATQWYTRRNKTPLLLRGGFEAEGTRGSNWVRSGRQESLRWTSSQGSEIFPVELGAKGSDGSSPEGREECKKRREDQA